MLILKKIKRTDYNSIEPFKSFILDDKFDEKKTPAVNVNPGVYGLLSLTSFARCIPSGCTESDLRTSLNFFLQKNFFENLETSVRNCHTADEVKPLHIFKK